MAGLKLNAGAVGDAATAVAKKKKKKKKNRRGGRRARRKRQEAAEEALRLAASGGVRGVGGTGGVATAAAFGRGRAGNHRFVFAKPPSPPQAMHRALDTMRSRLHQHHHRGRAHTTSVTVYNMMPPWEHYAYHARA